MNITRRRFLGTSSNVALSSAISTEAFAAFDKAEIPAAGQWDQGSVKHILPTVNDTQMLIKVSFQSGLTSPPVLQIGSQTVIGKMEDSLGENWSFYSERLTPDKTYELRLLSDQGKSLCAPWPLSTFPDPKAQVKNFRLLIYSCAGGHEC